MIDSKRDRASVMFFGKAYYSTVSPENNPGISTQDRYQLVGCYLFTIKSILIMPFSLTINRFKNFTLKLRK